MRRTIIFIFSCVIFFSSCTNKMDVPKKIIQPDKMGLILWDMMRMQYLAEFRADSDSLINKEAETKALTAKVFEIHKITSANFDKSYNWYVQHPQILKVILDSVQVQKQRERDADDAIEGDELHDPAIKKLERNKAVMEKLAQ